METIIGRSIRPFVRCLDYPVMLFVVPVLLTAALASFPGPMYANNRLQGHQENHDPENGSHYVIHGLPQIGLTTRN